MFRYRLVVILFIAAALGYVAVSFAAFQMPATAADAQNCGFLPDEFVSSGTLTYERSQAFLVSFWRKDEVFTAVSIGLAVTFAGFALTTGQRGHGQRRARAVGNLREFPRAGAFGRRPRACRHVARRRPEMADRAEHAAANGLGTFYLQRRAPVCALPQGGVRAPLPTTT